MLSTVGAHDLCFRDGQAAVLRSPNDLYQGTMGSQGGPAARGIPRQTAQVDFLLPGQVNTQQIDLFFTAHIRNQAITIDCKATQ